MVLSVFSVSATLVLQNPCPVFLLTHCYEYRWPVGGNLAGLLTSVVIYNSQVGIHKFHSRWKNREEHRFEIVDAPWFKEYSAYTWEHL